MTELQKTNYGQPQPSAGQSQPVYGQPSPGAPGQSQQHWMARPEAIPGCPPGLEYLTQIDQLLVHQQIELVELFTPLEIANRHAIKNSLGQQVYFASEESETCHRQCCGPSRGFVMHIADNMGQEVMRVNREFKCCAGCCWCAGNNCCAMVVTVEAPVGNVVGSVKQLSSGWSPKFEILDASDNVVFNIQGPCCTCQAPCCTQDVLFKVLSPDTQHEYGTISKQWAGICKEWVTSSDNFGVTFPMDLDVKMKATMVGALFLIWMILHRSTCQMESLKGIKQNRMSCTLRSRPNGSSYQEVMIIRRVQESRFLARSEGQEKTTITGSIAQ